MPSGSYALSTSSSASAGFPEPWQGGGQGNLMETSHLGLSAPHSLIPHLLSVCGCLYFSICLWLCLSKALSSAVECHLKSLCCCIHLVESLVLFWIPGRFLVTQAVSSIGLSVDWNLSQIRYRLATPQNFVCHVTQIFTLKFWNMAAGSACPCPVSWLGSGALIFSPAPHLPTPSFRPRTCLDITILAPHCWVNTPEAYFWASYHILAADSCWPQSIQTNKQTKCLVKN